MTADTRNEAVETYRARRADLIAQAQAADANRRLIHAGRLREAARKLSRAIEDELVNEQPTGLGTWERLP